MDMEITHVIRGDDHLNNTPRQMNMLRALGASTPGLRASAHDFGCRRHEALEAPWRRERASNTATMAILPEALLNYLVRLGWSHGDQEIFSIEEMIRLFDIARCEQSRPSAFNAEKLSWLNQQHMMQAPLSRLVWPLRWHLDRAGHFRGRTMGTIGGRSRRVQRERAKTMREMALNSLFFFRAPQGYDEKAGAQARHVGRPALARGPSRSVFGQLTQWSAPHSHELIRAGEHQSGLSRQGGSADSPRGAGARSRPRSTPRWQS